MKSRQACKEEAVAGPFCHLVFADRTEYQASKLIWKCGFLPTVIYTLRVEVKEVASKAKCREQVMKFLERSEVLFVLLFGIFLLVWGLKTPTSQQRQKFHESLVDKSDHSAAL